MLRALRRVRPPNTDVIPLDDEGQPLRPLSEPPAPGKTIPATCLRVLYSTLPQGYGGECPFDCEGRQEDHGCLADIVRAANEAGVEWSFDVRITDNGPIWTYSGEDIP